MRQLVLVWVFVVAFCACAAAQDASPTPSPDPADTWIGWGELPWVMPEVIDVPSVGLSLLTPDVLSFDSSVVMEILNRLEIPILQVSMKGFILVHPKKQVPRKGFVSVHPEKKAAAKMTARTVSRMIPLLRRNIAFVRRASIKDQATVMKSVLDSWEQFYALAGAPVQQAENHFGKLRMELQKRAETEGITPELLLDCATYQKELENAPAEKSP